MTDCVCPMPRYVAFLRGVSPMNLAMADLKRCLEQIGFTGVKTLLASGNAVFDSPSSSVPAIERRIEEALNRDLGHTFHTIVRSTAELKTLIDDDPYADFDLPPDAKRVVTFARELPKPKRRLPVERDGARILKADRREAFSAYVRSANGPVFMELIEEIFGKDVTTRTWDTVTKCAQA